MLMFGLGAVIPVLVVAYGSRRAILGRSQGLARLAAGGKPAMGALLVLVGALAFTGADKAIETWLVDHMPAWLIALTTAV